MSSDDLCKKCDAFDIARLYRLAAERVSCSRPRPSTTGGFAVYEGFPTFYSHHVGLKSLSDAAHEGCPLCQIIWKQAAHLLGLGNGDIDPQVLETYPEQIFLGLDQWSPEADGLPYLRASQSLPKDTFRQLATFDVYASHDIDTRECRSLLARGVESDSASPASLQTAQQWHEGCLKIHAKCAKLLSTPRRMPSRVIDVGSVEQNPRLIVTEGRKGAWAALSYCWGGDSPFKLTSETNDHFLNGKYSIDQYPRTLWDAVRITRRLDIQYLWIDALCILQDSAEDWAAEAARMRDVYGGALITIAATGSSSSTHGIFHQRRISTPLCSLKWRGSPSGLIDQVYMRSGSDFWDVNMRGEILNTRGWTLQEGLLSPRTLSYGSQQMLWECLELRTGENGRPILPGERHRDKAFIQRAITNQISPMERLRSTAARLSLKNMPVNRTIVPQSWEEGYEALYSRWFAIIKDFTARNLTVQSDTLPALSGLAATFDKLLQDEYMAGMWRENMIRELCWSRGGNATQQPQGQAKATSRADDSCLPSWSWVSVNSGTILNYLAEETTWPFITVEETSKIVNLHAKPRFDDAFGQLVSASLVIKGPFRQILDPFRDSAEGNAPSDEVLNRYVKTQLAIRTYREEYEQKHKGHENQIFAILRLLRTSRLFVSSVLSKDMYLPGASLLFLETTSPAKDQWRRVGFFPALVEADPREDDPSKLLLEEMDRNKWEVKSVTLV